MAKKVKINGTQYEIRPMKVRHFAKVAEAAKPVMGALANIGTSESNPEQAGLLAMQVIAEHVEDVARVLEAADVADLDTLLDMELDDFITLAMTFIQVNSDFFIKKVLPKIEKAMPKIVQ